MMENFLTSNPPYFNSLTAFSALLQASKLVTHRFAMNDIMRAYDTFGNGARESVLKVILTSGAPRS